MFITLLIVFNTIVLALDKYPEDPKLTSLSDSLNNFFTYAFIMEMVIKLIGLGFKEYARDSFNLFDSVIVILSVVGIVFTETTDDISQGGTLTAFKGVRLLRIFKLARSWTSFRKILEKVIITMRDVSTFSILLLLFMFIFTLLGMELFGHNVRFIDDKLVDPDEEGALSPRPNFDTLYMGFTTIFAIAIGDDWNYFMALAYRA